MQLRPMIDGSQRHQRLNPAHPILLTLLASGMFLKLPIMRAVEVSRGPALFDTRYRGVSHHPGLLQLGPAVARDCVQDGAAR
jgi:hypothetical protein